MGTVASSEREAKRVKAALEERWPAIPVLWKVGDPSEGLSDLAESGRYELLVLGNKGMKGLRRALGNVPLRTLKRAPASLLIVQTMG
jgi:nucleotide-binding universal stress UspA family protein